MTLCPVAIAITCRKCPAVGFCPGKEIIGDFKPAEADPTSGEKDAAAADSGARK